MKTKLTAKRSLSLMAVLALCMGIFGMVAPTAPVAEETPVPIYMDTSYTFAERAADLVSRMTLQEKASQLGNESAEIPRLGVAKYNYWSEGLHGVARSGEATSFPTSYGIAASWNRDLVQRITEVTADEARAYNNEQGKGLSYWSPTINMSRDPRWGRAEESYGEDPFLTTEIGSAFAKGLEGTDEDTKYLKVIATIKHYAANNSEFNRHWGNSAVDERALREYYTRAFKGVIQNTGVHSVMSSYNRVNEIPSAANEYLLTTLLRRTFGFTGYVTSDCGSIGNVINDHKYQPAGWDKPVDGAGATAVCITAGNDLECGGVFKGNAVAAVQRGLMTEDDIDVALVRMFTARMETGEFDPAEMVPYRSEEYSWDNQISADDHTAVALQSAEEAVTLLKNEPAAGETEPLLPLDAAENDNVVIVGENDLINNLILGDYSGTPNDANKYTPFKGIEKVLKELNPNATLTYLNTNASGANFFANFKNFELKTADGTTKTTLKPADAVDFDGCRHESNKTNFGYVYNSGWVRYDNVSFEDITQITVQASGDKNNCSHGDFEVRLGSKDGQLVGKVTSSATSGWTDYRVFTGEISAEDKGVTGPQTVYIVFNSGVEYNAFGEEQQKILREADTVIAYVGTRQSDSGESNDRRNINFPRFQSEMVASVLEINPRTVVYISSVAQMNIEGFREAAPAITWCTYNGQAQGLAAGNLLFGKANPSAKLTYTWYADESELPKIDDYNIYTTDTSNGRTYQYFSGKVSYPFGHGLSYTDFEYSNMQIEGVGESDGTVWRAGDVDGNGEVTANDALQVLQHATKKITLSADEMERADVDGTAGLTAGDALQILQCATKKITLPIFGGAVKEGVITPNDTLTVTVDVKNTGSVAGAEVVQAYVSSPLADKKFRPAKQLKGFDKVFLNAGETKTVTIELPVADWYFYDEEAEKNIYDQGNWTVEIGSSSGDIRAEQTVEMFGDLTAELSVVFALPSGHTLNMSNKTITTELSATMSDDSFVDLSKAEVKYTSSNTAVAVVDNNGTVRGVGAGAATITASVTVNGITKTSTFPVAVADVLNVSTITVDGKALEGYNPSTLNYSVMLESDATAIPVVDCPEKGEYVTVTQATAIPGTATVVVDYKGEVTTYSIYFYKMHEPVSTDFTKVTDLPDDWRVYDNGKEVIESPDNWKLTDKGLTITTEAGDLYQAHNDAKNIIVQDAYGDWVADTKFVMGDTFKGGYQQIAFLVFQDEDNYLKFSYESGNRLKVVQESGGNTGEKQPYNGGMQWSGDTQYFRIQKNGDEYSFFYSADGGATYILFTQVTATLKDVKLGFAAVNSFSGTPSPIDVSFEYLNVFNMKDCTCGIEALTFEDQVLDLAATAVGSAPLASITTTGECTIPGHDVSGAAYTYALKEGGENTCNATVTNNKVVAKQQGYVDLTVTAAIANGETATADARITVKATDGSLIAWLQQEEKASAETHALSITPDLGGGLDMTAYKGKHVYVEYEVMVKTTHTDPAPATDGWLAYVVNGYVQVNGNKIDTIGYNRADDRSFDKPGEWKKFKVEVPAEIIETGLISQMTFLTYNDVGGKYKDHTDDIEWTDNNGVVFYLRNAKLTTDAPAE